MPVLPLETYVFPEDLLDRTAPAGDDGDSWYVVHARPRAEKVIARWLVLFGTPFYLPLYARKFYHRNRLLTSYLPLFPGYLFVRASIDQRIDLCWKIDHVVRTLRAPDQDAFHQKLLDIRRLLESGVPVTPEERLQPGQWVEIKSGPLRGLEGKVIRRGKQFRFVIELDFLKRGVSCEVSGWQLRVLDGPPGAHVPRRRRRRRRRRRSGNA